MSPPVFQIAGDGRWETACSVSVSDTSTYLTARIEQVTAAAQRDVAVEVLWPGEVFVGVRWDLAESESALTGAHHARSVLSTPLSRPAEAAFVALLGEAPGPQPEFAELGAVNAWASTCPLGLWRRGETLTSAAVEEALASRPDLTRCAHPLAVEFASTVPRLCWIGVTVSTQPSPSSFHRVDRAALDTVLTRGVDASNVT
jgi:hypothetical protein